MPFLGDTPRVNDIYIALTRVTSGIPQAGFYSNMSHFLLYNSTSLRQNQWDHLAYVLNYPNHYFYLNGALVSSDTVNARPLNVFRNQTYIGRSNWHFILNDKADADADFDDIKLFNIPLTQSQVQFDMSNSLI